MLRVLDEERHPSKIEYGGVYWGIEVILGWVSLSAWILVAMMAGENHSSFETPSGLWPVSALLAILIGRVDYVGRALRAIHYTIHVVRRLNQSEGRDR